jgi:hypothetical protein
MSIAMEPTSEHDSKQASQAEPAMKWNVDTLIGWIKQKKIPLLTDDVLQILKEKIVNVEVFLNANLSIFQYICGLSPETAVVLANLSRELAKEEGKLLSFISCTPLDSKLTTSQQTDSRPKM